MNPSREQLACARIITRLASTGPRVFEGDLPSSIQQVTTKYPPADEVKIERILKRTGGFDSYSARAFVYARPTGRNTPTLWPVLVFSASQGFEDFKIRVALFFHVSQQDENSGSTLATSGQPKAVAWRFEPPEGESGAHCYYHAQPISSWDNSDSGRLPVALPLNESQPAFPLIAEDSIGLLAALLVSLYGHEETKRFLGYRGLRDDVLAMKDSFAALRLLKN